jgi:hypothetical protein
MEMLLLPIASLTKPNSETLVNPTNGIGRKSPGI